MMPFAMSSDEIKRQAMVTQRSDCSRLNAQGSANEKQHESVIMALYLDPETVALLRELSTTRGPASRRSSKPPCRRARWPYAFSNPQREANVTVIACVTPR